MKAPSTNLILVLAVLGPMPPKHGPKTHSNKSVLKRLHHAHTIAPRDQFTIQFRIKLLARTKQRKCKMAASLAVSLRIYRCTLSLRHPESKAVGLPVLGPCPRHLQLLHRRALHQNIFGLLCPWETARQIETCSAALVAMGGTPDQRQ